MDDRAHEPNYIKLLRSVCRVEANRREFNPMQPFEIVTKTKSTGSGFFIDLGADRVVVLTCAHVVAHTAAEDVHIVLPTSHQSGPRGARVVAVMPEFDIAVLRCDGLPPRDAPDAIVPLTISARQLEHGKEVFACGYPLGMRVSAGQSVQT